jgi:hypothetical protein
MKPFFVKPINPDTGMENGPARQQKGRCSQNFQGESRPQEFGLSFMATSSY